MLVHVYATGIDDLSVAEKSWITEKMEQLQRYLGALAGDTDTTICKVELRQSRHQSGTTITARSHISSSHKGDFEAQASGNTLGHAVQKLAQKLKAEMTGFHKRLSVRHRTGLKDLR